MKTGMKLTGALFLCGALGTALPPASRAELIEQRLGLEPVRLSYGPGTTRLDGMGLSLSAPDENNEINLFDFGDNPAGLLTDRDAWSIDFRVAHREYVERDARLSGFDYKGNTYSFLGAYRKTDNQGFAGGYDYVQSSLRQGSEPRTEFENSRYRFLYNRFIGRASFGFEFRYEKEVEDLLNPDRIYYIEHGSDAFVGVAGLAYPVHEYVTVALRGDIRRANIDGTSESDSHQDLFSWRRPSGSVDAQGFVNHPRVKGGLSVGRVNGAGEESIEVGWSPLFIFNPTLRFVRFEKDTFTEDTESDRLSTRWEVEAVPGLFSVVGAFRTQSGSTRVTSIPVVLGSLESVSFDTEQSDLGFGGNLLLLNQRLFLGGEFHRFSDRLTDLDVLEGYERERTTSAVSVGAEYLLFENLAIRNGWAFRSDDRTATSGSAAFEAGFTGSSSATTASFGLGLVPGGGILQLDAAYSLDVSSDLDIDQSGFALYARLLF